MMIFKNPPNVAYSQLLFRTVITKQQKENAVLGGFSTLFLFPPFFFITSDAVRSAFLQIDQTIHHLCYNTRKTFSVYCFVFYKSIHTYKKKYTQKRQVKYIYIY